MASPSGWLYSYYLCYYWFLGCEHLNVPSNARDFFQRALPGIADTMLWCCTCHNPMLVLNSEEEIVWYLPKFLKVYFLEKVAGCCLCLQDPCNSYCSIMLGIPMRREVVFSCNKNCSQSICFVFWVLVPSFSMSFLKTSQLPLLLFASHPPCACCVLFIILPSKGILNASII